MKNVTITMEDAALEWVRVQAAKLNISVSRYLGQVLEEEMRRSNSYEQAMRSALKFESWGASDGAMPSGERCMTARSPSLEQPIVFVDSNVLLASFDSRDAALQTAAQDWLRWCWQKRSGRISTQVLNELYEGSVRAFGLNAQTPTTPAQVRLHVRRLREWQPPHLDRFAVDGAWDLQDRHGLSYWNALIVSSALQQSCTHLLSLELPPGELDGIQIISPLTLRPQDLDNA